MSWPCSGDLTADLSRMVIIEELENFTGRKIFVCWESNFARQEDKLILIYRCVLELCSAWRYWACCLVNQYNSCSCIRISRLAAGSLDSSLMCSKWTPAIRITSQLRMSVRCIHWCEYCNEQYLKGSWWCLLYVRILCANVHCMWICIDYLSRYSSCYLTISMSMHFRVVDPPGCLCRFDLLRGCEWIYWWARMVQPICQANRRLAATSVLWGNIGGGI